MCAVRPRTLALTQHMLLLTNQMVLISVCSPSSQTNNVCGIRYKHLTSFFVLFFNPRPPVYLRPLLSYQRKHSSFTLAKGPELFPWRDILSDASWFHCTGITPLLSDSAYANWNEALQTARSLDIPISFDLNHRQALGSIEKLWAFVSPHVSSFQLLVLAQANLPHIITLMSLHDDVKVCMHSRV